MSEVTIPGHEVEIFEADHISRRSMMGNDLLNDINSRIKLVVGDFRQKEILEGWKKVFENKSDEIFTIDKISMSVSGSCENSLFFLTSAIISSIPLLALIIFLKSDMLKRLWHPQTSLHFI